MIMFRLISLFSGPGDYYPSKPPAHEVRVNQCEPVFTLVTELVFEKQTSLNLVCFRCAEKKERKVALLPPDANSTRSDHQSSPQTHNFLPVCESIVSAGSPGPGVCACVCVCVCVCVNSYMFTDLTSPQMILQQETSRV